MLTDWIPRDSLAGLNDGSVVIALHVSEAAWAAHEATDHFKAAVKELLPRVNRRERVPFIPFP